MTNLFDKNEAAKMVVRLNQLTENTAPQWGKMKSAQMLAHCAATFDAAFEENPARPNAVVRLLIKAIAKDLVVGLKPYGKNTRTAPSLVVADERDFETEKKRLLDNFTKLQDAGASHFENRTHPVFGTLSSEQWNTLFSKHLDHHLTQFGV